MSKVTNIVERLQRLRVYEEWFFSNKDTHACGRRNGKAFREINLVEEMSL